MNTLNRKLLFIIIAILLALNGFIGLKKSYDQASIQRAETMSRLSSKKYQLFKIPKTPTSNHAYKQIVTALNHAAKDTHINYLKQQTYYGWGIKNHHVDYSQSLTQVTFQVSTVKPTQLWANIHQPQRKVSGKSFVLYQSNLGFKLTIEPINQSVRHDQREGDYYLESASPSTYRRFLALSAHYLNQLNGRHYSIQDFEPGKSYQPITVNFDQPYSSDYQAITTLFLIIFTIILLLANSQSIANYRLNGWSSSRIFSRCFGKVIILAIIFMTIEIMILALMGWPIFTTGLASTITALLLTILTAWLTIVGLGFSSLTNQIQRRNYNRWSFIGLYFVKACFIVYLFIGLIPLMQVATRSYGVIKSNTTKTTIGEKYAVFYPYVNGNNYSDGLNMAEGEKLDNTMYPIMNKYGSILFDDAYIHQNISLYGKYVIVNPNYLIRYPLYDTNHKAIKISQKAGDIWLLLPTNRKMQAHKIVADVKSDEKADSGYNPKVKVIYYPASQHIMDLSTGNKIQSWPVFVTTPQNTSFVSRNIMNGQEASDGLKVPIAKNVLATYQSIKPSLIKYNYLDNYPQLVKLNDLAMEDLKLAVGNLYQSATALIFSALIIFFLTAYITMLYFKVNQNALTIKRLNGFSFSRTYRPLLGLLSLQTGVMSYLTIFQHNNNLYYWSLTVLITLIELGIELFTTQTLEHKNMKELLNDK
ncbi:DUF1430 domain-containing protein [Lactiplantibacillus plantarum]|uniref:DUF1430 domain-containing protein n=1 Tax=Lactiplantibacillus plantarum TaxID=1590 RepID=UPI001C9E5BC7|nr:DUF1430 domain-containing protein [Lactiplantibacillus plantarum]